MNEMSDVELAWLAGLVDSEGCIHSRPSGRIEKGDTLPYRMQLKIAMCHRETVERAQAIVGLGTVGKYEYKGRPKWRTSWSWSVYGWRAIELLNLLVPYMVTKGEEAEQALRWIDLEERHNQGTPWEDMLTEFEEIDQNLRALKRADGAMG